MTGTPTRIGERHVAAVLAMGGGLMLGPAPAARAGSSGGRGLPARASDAGRPTGPVTAAGHTAADLTAPAPPGGAPRGTR